MSDSKYPTLLSSFSMGDLNLKNRVVMAPMTRGRAGPEYTANELMAKYYAQRASSAFIITEATHISLVARGWYEAPDVYTPEHAKGWKIVTDAVHEADGLIFCQLWHTGRASHSSFRTGLEQFPGDMAKPVAPSALKRASKTGKQMFTPLKGDDVVIEQPREMTLEEIKALPEEFRNAAQTAKDGGFDGVEVHCANGYLLDEFLQTVSNKRTDEYGGSFENRFRIVDEVLQAIFTVFEPSKVGLRISPNGVFNGMGAEDNREAFLYYAERLATYNLGYLHIMIGLGFGFHGFGEPMVMSEFRAVYPGVLIANVGYDAESAEAEISSGNTDLVAFARPYIANPDLVERFRTGAKLAESDKDTYYSTADKRASAEGYTSYPPLG